MVSTLNGVKEEPSLEPHPDSDDSPKRDIGSRAGIPSGLVFVVIIVGLVVLLVLAHVMGIIGPGIHGGGGH